MGMPSVVWVLVVCMPCCCRFVIACVGVCCSQVVMKSAAVVWCCLLSVSHSLAVRYPSVLAGCSSVANS